MTKTKSGLVMVDSWFVSEVHDSMTPSGAPSKRRIGGHFGAALGVRNLGGIRRTRW